MKRPHLQYTLDAKVNPTPLLLNIANRKSVAQHRKWGLFSRSFGYNCTSCQCRYDFLNNGCVRLEPMHSSLLEKSSVNFTSLWR
jgi:hypothetical protein